MMDWAVKRTGGKNLGTERTTLEDIFGKEKQKKRSVDKEGIWNKGRIGNKSKFLPLIEWWQEGFFFKPLLAFVYIFQVPRMRVYGAFITRKQMKYLKEEKYIISPPSYASYSPLSVSKIENYWNTSVFFLNIPGHPSKRQAIELLQLHQNSGALAQPPVPQAITRGVTATQEALSETGKPFMLVSICLLLFRLFMIILD